MAVVGRLPAHSAQLHAALIVMSDLGSMREAQLEACQELVLLCLLTIMPPERVGIIRKLNDSTLRQTEAGWVIDMTKERRGHKTARFTGLVLPYIALRSVL